MKPFESILLGIATTVAAFYLGVLERGRVDANEAAAAAYDSSLDAPAPAWSYYAAGCTLLAYQPQDLLEKVALIVPPRVWKCPSGCIQEGGKWDYKLVPESLARRDALQNKALDVNDECVADGRPPIVLDGTSYKDSSKDTTMFCGGGFPPCKNVH